MIFFLADFPAYKNENLRKEGVCAIHLFFSSIFVQKRVKAIINEKKACRH